MAKEFHRARMATAVRRSLALLAAAVSMGCTAKAADSPAGGSRYLYVWAGPHVMAQAHGGSAASDFVAVLDADPSSRTYGKVLASQGAGIPGEMAHHAEYTLPAGHPLFANDYAAGRIFLIDLAQPLTPRVVQRIDSVPGFRLPHSFVRLPNGHVLTTLQFGNRSLPGDPGGLAEFEAGGRLLRTVSSADPAFPGAAIRTYGLEVLPAIDRAVTTSSPMDSEHPANVIQLWRLSDLRLLRTIPLPAIAGDSVEYYPFEVRALPDGRTAFLNTYNCGFYTLSDLETDSPKVELVHSMRAPRRVGCAVPVVAGRFWVMPIAYDHSVVTLDLRDPRHPAEISVLRTDSVFLPHWSALDPGSDRIVVVGQDDGEARVLMARVDRTSGRLSWDSRFRDPGSPRPGVAFGGPTWPHGSVRNAMPHAALFGPARQ